MPPRAPAGSRAQVDCERLRAAPRRVARGRAAPTPRARRRGRAAVGRSRGARAARPPRRARDHVNPRHLLFPTPCGPVHFVRVQLVRRDGRDVSTLYGREGGGAVPHAMRARLRAGAPPTPPPALRCCRRPASSRQSVESRHLLISDRLSKIRRPRARAQVVRRGRRAAHASRGNGARPPLARPPGVRGRPAICPSDLPDGQLTGHVAQFTNRCLHPHGVPDLKDKKGRCCPSLRATRTRSSATSLSTTRATRAHPHPRPLHENRQSERGWREPSPSPPAVRAGLAGGAA